MMNVLHTAPHAKKSCVACISENALTHMYDVHTSERTYVRTVLYCPLTLNDLNRAILSSCFKPAWITMEGKLHS